MITTFMLFIVLQQAIGNVAEQLAQDIEANNPGEGGVWLKAAKELRFPCVPSHSPHFYPDVKT